MADHDLNWGLAEIDPNGIDQHVAGAKLDAGKNRVAMVLSGFSDALLEVGKVGTFGADKYTDFGWRAVPNGYQRYSDAMLRHFFAATDIDEDSGMLHDAQTAWNALARLQFKLDELHHGQRTGEGAGTLTASEVIVTQRTGIGFAQLRLPSEKEAAEILDQ